MKKQSYGSRHPASTPTKSIHKDSTSMAARSEAYKNVLSNGGDHKSAVAAYVSGNVHAEETARNTGNT